MYTKRLPLYQNGVLMCVWINIVARNIRPFKQAAPKYNIHISKSYPIMIDCSSHTQQLYVPHMNSASHERR